MMCSQHERFSVAKKNEEFLDDDDEIEGSPSGDLASGESSAEEVKPKKQIFGTLRPDHHRRLMRLAAMHEAVGNRMPLSQLLEELLGPALDKAEAEYAEELAMVDRLRERLSKRR